MRSAHGPGLELQESKIMKRFLSIVPFLALALTLTGCPPKGDSDESTGKTGPNFVVSQEKDGHAGAHSGGPNGGVVAVLGNHEYHAEAFADEASGLVTVLLYDQTHDFVPVAVDAKELNINMVVDDAPSQFTLKIADDAEEGKPAPYTITDEKLAEWISDGWNGKATIQIVISDKSLSGTFGQPEKHEDH